MLRRFRSTTVVLLAALLSTVAAGRVSAAGVHSTNSPAELDMKKFQLAPGLKIELAAAEPLLSNPVCFSIDAQGRFFVVETHRYRKSIFDITANTPWLLDDLSLRTVNDREAFLARTFATNFSVLTNDSELIRVVEDHNGDGIAETSSIFASGFNQSISGTAAGVLAQGTNLWFACIPDLWRFSIFDFRFTNASRVGGDVDINPPLVNRKSQIVNGLGVHISVSGHDVHGLIRGPDGRIYFSFGDRGVCVTNREGVVLNVPDTGGVLRCEPDGRAMEIFCTGLRNPQELAFDDFGNLWTVDNDTAGADPCRVLHLIEGGDYGWRASYQHMKGFGPWVQEELWRGGLDGVLPPAGTVSQGPAGLAFHPGTSLAPQLAGKFVHADFPGGVWAYDVKPRGASYELAGKEKILWNCWPTDVEFGPDGALYVLDWVQGWAPPGRGRIYRLTANAELGKRNAEQVADVKRLLGEGMSRRTEKELLALLGHPDRRARLEAQWELAAILPSQINGLTNRFEAFVGVALRKTNRLARLHALWGIGQLARQSYPWGLDRELAELGGLMGDADEWVAATTMRMLGEARVANAQAGILSHLKRNSPHLLAASVSANRELLLPSRLTGIGGNRRHAPDLKLRLKDLWFEKALGTWNPGVRYTIEVDTGDLLEMFRLSGAGDLFLAHEVTRSLEESFRQVPSWVSRWERHADPMIRQALVMAMRRAEDAAVSSFLADRDARVVLQAVRAINDAPIPGAYPALAALLDEARFRDANWGWSALSNLTFAGPFSAKVRPPREQVLLRALNANFRIGDRTNAEALVKFARAAPGSGVSDHLRAEALFLLGAWEVLPAKVGDLPIKPAKDPNHGSVPTVNPENWPGWFDRVVGLWRPLPPRPPDIARATLGPEIGALLNDASTDVALGALDAAVKLRLTPATPVILVRLRDLSAPRAFRRQATSALAALNSDRLSDAVKMALADADLEVRASALPYLDRLGGDDSARILSGFVATPLPVKGTNEGPLRLAQAALATLGRLSSAEAAAALRGAMQSLSEGKLPPALELDVVEAASHFADAEIKSLLARREAGLPKTDALGPWRATLAGGDAQRGREIFLQKAEVQCSRCHALKGEGGNVGPALDAIAKTRNREYLLESIVLPNKAMAAGFENVLVTMKIGAIHAGLVKGETEAELRLESPEDGPLKLTKADIASRQRGLSAMPDDLKQFLTPREVRDLVEFLAGLK